MLQQLRMPATHSISYYPRKLYGTFWLSLWLFSFKESQDYRDSRS